MNMTEKIELVRCLRHKMVFVKHVNDSKVKEDEK